MRLLDVLEAHRGATINDGGEEWSVAEYKEEWEAGAEPDDRGPEVICLAGEDGGLHLLTLNEHGALVEAVSVFDP